MEPLDGGVDSLHPCSWQFPTAAPAMAHTHGTRSDLSWDLGSAHAWRWQQLCSYTRQGKLGQECGGPTWSRITRHSQNPRAPGQGIPSGAGQGKAWAGPGDPGVGGTELQHKLPECPPGTGIPTLLEAPQPTLSAGRGNSGPCIWLYKTGLQWLQPLLCIKSQSTTGNCLWTAHPIPHFILGRDSIPTSPSQRG